MMPSIRIRRNNDPKQFATAKGNLKKIAVLACRNGRNMIWITITGLKD